jgi:hypothetical protein
MQRTPFNSYVILADTFDTSGAIGMDMPVVTNLFSNTISSITLLGASVSIYANTIINAAGAPGSYMRAGAPLSVNVSGTPGVGGAPGKAGPPGGVGGPGGGGFQGKPGGNVVIRYASVASAPTASAASPPTPPTASALGGPGGPGGAGGKAGATLGVHEGKAGQTVRPAVRVNRGRSASRKSPRVPFSRDLKPIG